MSTCHPKLQLLVAEASVWLSIAAWLLALPVSTLAPLLKTQSAALMLLWFTALAVKFANCAYQDGGVAAPYPRWLGRVPRLRG